jgi:hypothetical protein
MKTFNIEIPKGYEIDKEKSTFETIIFKEVKNEIPKTWEELKVIKGAWVTEKSMVLRACTITVDEINKNVFATKEQAEASIALAQLSQLREVYRNGWVPNWRDGSELKYSIFFSDDKIIEETLSTASVFLSFQDEKTRDLFLENFKDLILTAKPLMS